MEMVLLISAGFVIFVGIVLRVFNLSFMIAGYNTASKEEKSKYNEKALVKAVSNYLIFSSLVLVLGYVLSSFFEHLAGTILTWTWVAYVVYVIIGLVHINNNPKIKREE